MNASLLVVCPVFNEADRIGTLVESIAKKSQYEIEFVIVDSGSTDGSSEILERQAGENFTFIHFEDNLGITSNWARAINSAMNRFESSSHVMMLGGDDTLGEGFFDEIFSNLSKADSGEKVLVPDFLKQGRVEEGHLRWVRVLPKLAKPGFFSFALNWEWAHVCYGVFPAKFMEQNYLPCLDSGSVAFDWLVANEALDFDWEFCTSAKYFKFNKQLSYESSYYMDSGRSGQNSEKPRNRFFRRITHLAALPLIQTIELARLSKSQVLRMATFRQIEWLALLLLGRSLDHFRKLLRRAFISKPS